MKLLPNININPFLRMAWVSEEARAKWETVIRECAQMVQELEIGSVAAGQRACAWRTVARESLPGFVASNAKMGLVTIPVQWVGGWQGFVHYTPKGDSQAYCIVSRTLVDAEQYREYFNSGDHDSQGRMLGFPECCRKAFAENWKDGYFDPIYQAWEKSCGEVHSYSNPLLRYVGLRVGFHIPHSFDCQETINAGAERLSLAKDRDLVKLLTSLLSMPMRWEALHGIAVVRTPIFYIVTSTVPTGEKYTIDVEGKFIPREGQWQKNT